MVVSAWSAYVGSETGLLKGVNLEKKSYENFNTLNDLNKEKEITDLCWHNSEQQIYVGQKDGIVKIFDCSQNSFVKNIKAYSGDSSLRGVASYDGKILTANESGIVKLWSEDGSKQLLELNAGSTLYRMRQNAAKPHLIATGGEENDLKIWDLEKPSEPTFRAKNVRNDFLDLRVPVWITDMQFVPNSEKVITCTRHHQIRLYDPSSSQRRPVISMEFETHPLISLSLTHQENQLIVGSSRGRMALIDLRRKALVHVFKGFAGSIRHVQCHKHLPVVASCGLDRFLRIHDLNSRKLLSKIYLKSRLNCLLMRSDFNGKIHNLCEVPKSVKIAEVNKYTDGDNCDELWNDMEVVGQKTEVKKRLHVDKAGAVVAKKKIKRHPG